MSSACTAAAGSTATAGKASAAVSAAVSAAGAVVSIPITRAASSVISRRRRAHQHAHSEIAAHAA